MIMTGDLSFNMLEQTRPTSGSTAFLLKRWTKHTIYSKSGSYVRSDLPSENLYQSASVYLYDYVVVTEAFYNSLVYTASIIDTTPSVDSDWVDSQQGWQHYEGTFRNTPNATVNNFSLTYDPVQSVGLGHPVYGQPYIFRDDGIYFEVVSRYQRNHFTHKRDLFSLYQILSFGETSGEQVTSSYYRNRQTTFSTIGIDGLEDGSSPITVVQVGNVDLNQTDNVINA